MSRFGAALLALALAFGSSIAAAAPRIVLIGRDAEDPIVARLRAELEALGFEVVPSDRDDVSSRGPLEATARRLGAVAAVRLVASNGGVEVWIVDRVTGKTVLRDVVQAEPSGPDREGVAALRVVELLRASFLEVNAPHPSRGEVDVSPEVRDAAALPTSSGAPAPRVAAKLGAGLIASPGGVAATASGSLELEWMPTPHFGVEALTAVSLFPSHVSAAEGTAAVSSGLAGGGIRFGLLDPRARWSPAIGAGLVGVWFDARGTPAAHYVAQELSVLTVAPYLEAGIGLALVEHVRMRADLLTAVTVERPVVVFAGRDVANWGRPLFVPSLGFEVSWP